MTVVVAPDKFKGSATADEVARHLAAGIRAAAPGTEVVEVPVADGGEGTVDAALRQGFRAVPVRVRGPLGAPVDAVVAVREGTAVVELAQASGLALVEGAPDPLAATTYGTGQLVAAALDAGCRTVVLGLGGSASTDGGAGLLQALGATLLDAGGAPVPAGEGHPLVVHGLDLAGLDPRLRAVDVVVATDVDNPLLGPRGAAPVFAPQKGADPGQVGVLAEALGRWADLLGAAAGAVPGAGVVPGANATPGAGAAGGVGFAALAALGARVRPGVDVVLELVGLADALTGARLVVTGEGSLDEQSAGGKAPVGVARAAVAAGVPVVAVAGRVALGPDRLRALGFRAAYALADLEPDPARSMAGAPRLLREVGRRIGATL
ncbi:glycerate kinase [Cellulomonas pakistanensis]|uniref:Glycerate kinase n=1 Tax=Cellulomonas pakistanensis TaxID=992287 RepID=A0A919P9M7_9CELL|nr:glycerate kinase [Cellulomonas pakistanensis]GIG35540.1 glycerate kinase [Cellulomonas pakistanensis]